ncbi:MAG: peptidoglycan-binding protein, partial [Elainellaceae cyanobacterium]
TSRRSVPSSHRSHQSFYNCNALVRRCLTVALAAAGGIIVLANSAIAQILPLGQVLSFGDSGPEVEQLQIELQRQGLFDGPISGQYLELTQEAVIRLQQRNGLTADGVFGPLSEDALFGRSPQVTVFAPVPPNPNVITTLPPLTAPPVTGTPSLNDDTLLGQLPDPSTASCSVFISSGGGLADAGTIQRGDAGESVRIVQQQLTDRGFDTQGIDGIFGANTERAVVLFQRSEDIEPANGIVDEETARALGLLISGDEQPLTNTGPYAVVVPAKRDDLETLRIVRREVPRACFASSRLGSYVYAGGFQSRSSAESLSLRLRSLDLDSRVDFRRRVRGI